MCGAEPAFPSFVVSCGAAIRASRSGPARSLPRVEMSPQQPLQRRWERFRSAIPRSPDLSVVLNDDFRPAASHIRSSPDKADRLSARIGTQAQHKQIGETEGSLDVEPVVRF